MAQQTKKPAPADPPRAELAQEILALEAVWRTTTDPEALRILRERAQAFLETYR